jgi:hypothetical protein
VGFTLNSDTPYAGGILDLRESGPMVVELPPGPLVGLADDHHQRWITDMGLAGADAGKGGRHLILPPGWAEPVPDGYLAARSDTWFVLMALRALPIGGDLDAALELLTSVKIYPLKDGNPAEYTFADATERDADTSPLAWEGNLDFWRVLHEVIDAEPPIEEMRAMLGNLAELGIQAGQPFRPSADTARLLALAAATGRDEMLVSAFASRRPDRMVWPGRFWEWVGLRPENGSFEHRIARRRGAGPLVRPGHRRFPGDVPPRGRTGLPVLARLPRQHRRLPGRRPRLQAHRPAAGAREPVLVRHLL